MINMQLTKGQQNALSAFRSGKNILLLGDSGTGKTTLISAIVEEAQSKGLRVAKTASTGIAAQLIGGRTIHSFLKAYPKMDFSKIDYRQKISELENVDVLIIDEISMLNSSFIEYMYRCLECLSHSVQLILVGDFFQLPPVKGHYAFESFCWNSLNLTPCILTEVIRQDDNEFIKHLNLLKYGDSSCLEYFLSNSSPKPISGQISICAKRAAADRINKAEINKLNGKQQIYQTNYDGTVSSSDIPIEECLIIKPGMRVMSLINGTGYSNGSLGTVINCDPKTVLVHFDNGKTFRFGRACFSVERSDLIGTTTEIWQIPLRPAYAITIHKSQGQTFDNVNIDGTECWASGQLYVAISRARRIEGIHFLTPINKNNIKTNPLVVDFYKSLYK